MKDTLPLVHPPQPRRSMAKAKGLYQTILFLRGAGHTVYACGRYHHVVDGKIMSDGEIRRVAALI